MKHIGLLIIIVMFMQNNLFAFRRVTSDWEARTVLRENGITSSNILEGRDIIVVNRNHIIGISAHSTLTTSISRSINRNNIRTLSGVSAISTSSHSNRVYIESKSSFGSIYAVVVQIGNNHFLIVGTSLRDIVNHLAI